MAGETGGGGAGRDLTLRAPLNPVPGCDPGEPICNENGPLLVPIVLIPIVV